jgi:hypothetical protein
MVVTDWLGWAATGVFVASYACRRPETLRRFQMAGATMWIVYGVLMQAAPVVVANVLVLGAAAWASRRSLRVQAPDSGLRAPGSGPLGRTRSRSAVAHL